jgi:hypothetical protein
MAEVYASTHGGKLDGFEALWQQHVNETPIFVRDDTSPTGIHFTDEGAPATPAPATPAPTAAGGDDVPEGTIATGPDGKKIILKNGQWVPHG